MTSQLERLARPFPDRLIHTNPSGGGSYVKHSVVTEKLLAVVGPFSFELVEVVRGDVAERRPNPSGKSDRARDGAPALSQAAVGAVCRLTVEVDGRVARIEEVGDCEQPHNWPHDGARLKDAMSDALKRCAMRLGVTLHLWSGAEFSLYDQLRSDENAEGVFPKVSAGKVQAPAPLAAPSASSPAVDAGERPAAANAGGVSSPPATSKNRIQTLVARSAALRADNVNVDALQVAWQLPDINKCDGAQLTMWDELLRDAEAALTAPFEPSPA